MISQQTENRQIRTIFIGSILKIIFRVVSITSREFCKLLWEITITKKLEKLSRLYMTITTANDVDFVSQIFAHFGIKPNDKDENSLFIGGSSSMININEQINQNLTPGNKAFYGAAPQGNGSAGIKFTAKTYGVVIGIYRCVPVLDFAHNGIDRTLLKTDASD
jgi:hypothetical protein